MIKINKWSLVGILAGITFIIISIIRYYFLFHDTDKAIAYVCIGILICAVAWLYDRDKKTQTSILTIEDYISDKEYEKKEGVKEKDEN